MSFPNLPNSQSQISDANGFATIPWYTFWRNLIQTLNTQGTDTNALQAALDELQKQVNALPSGGSQAYWGTIGGTLSDQSDLQDALDLKMTHPQTMARVSLGF